MNHYHHLKHRKTGEDTDFQQGTKGHQKDGRPLSLAFRFHDLAWNQTQCFKESRLFRNSRRQENITDAASIAKGTDCLTFANAKTLSEAFSLISNGHRKRSPIGSNWKTILCRSATRRSIGTSIRECLTAVSYPMEIVASFRDRVITARPDYERPAGNTAFIAKLNLRPRKRLNWRAKSPCEYPASSGRASPNQSVPVRIPFSPFQKSGQIRISRP